MIYRGAQLDADIPSIDLVSFTLERAEKLSAKPALIDGPSGRVLSYGELRRSVRSLAAGLSARGFEGDDTFAIFMPNVPEYAIAFYGPIAAGGRCTTANPLYTARELAFQLADSGASMLLTVPAFMEVAREAARDAGCELFVLGEADGAASFAELLGDPDEAPEPAIEPASHVAALPYSSGTTGLPKGVMLSHRNLVANTVQANALIGLSPEDTVIAVMPFFHCYGLCVIMGLGLQAGATLVTMPRFELRQYLELSERHRVTRAYVVPPIALALAKDPAVRDYDLSSLRLVISGAAPLGVELEAACAERIGCRVGQGYGMTELSPVSHATPAGQVAKGGSIGRLAPSTEARLVDPASGEDVAPGERGELLIRGPQVMLGYLNNPAATEATIDKDGWLHTGDVATVDEDGLFFIVDRVKELIKYKGFQVAPAELEAILFSHPQVTDCAVIGVPDDEAGEVPKAFIVPAGEVEPDLEQISEFVARQVAPHKRIRQFEVIAAIPKSPSGKILRRVLRDRAPVRA
jgi:acyl-CoA synthetase (AMP-forming)/AMP-acid ligase II